MLQLLRSQFLHGLVRTLMHNLLLIGLFIFMAFLAPLRVTLITCLLFALVIAVVMFSAHAVAGIKATVGEAARAVGLSFLFLFVAVFTLFSFSVNAGIHEFRNLAGLTVFGALFVSYALGFSIALRATLGSSIVIAILATTISGALIVAGRSLI